MRIGFDMDGVLRTSNLGLLKACIAIDDFEPYKIDQLTSTQPLLNPNFFGMIEDELYCITNCMSDESAASKKVWLQHFYGDRVNLIPIQVATNAWGEDYAMPIAKAKLEKVLEEGIEVYFEDDPMIVRFMRELLTGKRNDSVKIIKYGPWVKEYTG